MKLIGPDRQGYLGQDVIDVLLGHGIDLSYLLCHLIAGGAGVGGANRMREIAGDLRGSRHSGRWRRIRDDAPELCGEEEERLVLVPVLVGDVRNPNRTSHCAPAVVVM